MGEVSIKRLDADFADWGAVLSLISRSFAYMDGIVDPPSSAKRLTVDALAGRAVKEVAFAAFEDSKLVGCVFVELRPDHAYIGKLAVEPGRQKGGLGRLLVEAAEALARKTGLGAIELQTRVELTGNHAAFIRLGFAEVGRTAHAGFDRPTSITMRKMLA
jgi:GNAT superfamily N-acetyltransferase